LSKRKETDDFLDDLEQIQKGHWMDGFQQLAQNAINLASQDTRALTIRDWLPVDCEKFLEDLEKKFKKERKSIDIYLPQESYSAVNK
jgi:hypothetical protein